MKKLMRKIRQSDLIRSSWRRVIHLWKPMAMWTLLVWSIMAIILAPISSAVLGLQFFRSGELVIANKQLFSWILSPMGLGYILFGASLTLTGWILRFAGIFQITANNIHGQAVDLRNIILRIGSKFHILFRLCLFIVASGMLLLVPLAAGLAVTYKLFLDTYDINYYLSTTPTEWHIAIIISILWVVIWLLSVIYIAARTLLSLPAYLHSRKSIKESIAYAWRKSLRKTKHHLSSVLAAIGFWLLLRFLISMILFTASAGIITWLNNDIESLQVMALATGFYLISSLTVDAIISFLGFSYVSTFISSLYFSNGYSHKLADVPPSRYKFQKLLRPKYLFIIIGLSALVSLGMSSYIIEQVPQPNPSRMVTVVAHRAGPAPAPENTLRALDLSMQSKAGFAEIDVQLSRDSVIVAAHDNDLMRKAGNPARIAETRFDSLQKIIRKAYSQGRSRQQRLNTLDEFLAASRGKIKLMIELKRADETLARNVISAIRKRGMEQSVIVMSMNPNIIRKLQNIAPDISIGYISAFSLGDISRLPVEILAINHRSVTRQLVTAAHQQELDVYAWTVNRTETMVEMIQRNADGIITDQPALAIRIRNEMRELTTAERLLLRFYQLLDSEIAGVTY